MPTVQKMETRVYSGDWHDKPLCWEVLGPGSERQMFSTRAEARRYAAIRRESSCFQEACRRF
jgi:hypothetical protein